MKIFWLGLLFLFMSCGQTTEHKYSYYYWKTQFSLNEKEQNALNQATVDEFFVRFFDVDVVNGKIQIVAPLKQTENYKSTKKVVPVVFITNRVFTKLADKNEIREMAQWVYDTTQSIDEKLDQQELSEIQIDCDWTASTRDHFFEFLKELKRLSNVRISSTLR